MQDKVLLIGSNGGVGSALRKELLNNGYLVANVTRKDIDLSSVDAEVLLHKLLDTHQPDIVINCAGVFGDNNIQFDTIFNTNVKTNWSILNYYRLNKPIKVVKFITIGSSSYDSGRKNYILYAATKAALFNMYQGASEYFADKNLIIGLVNPGKIRTPMIEHLITKDTACLDPTDIAQCIITFFANLQNSSYINIK